MLAFDFQRAIIKGIGVRGELAYFFDGKYSYADKDIPIFIDGKQATDEEIEALLAQASAAGADVGSLNNISKLPTPVKKKMVEYTLGVDDTDLFGINNLYGNIQIYQKFIVNHDESLIDDAVTTWFLGKIEYSMLRTKLKIFNKTLFDAGDPSAAVNLGVSYRLSELCTASLGTWQVFGDDDNMIGQYNKDDYYYINAVAKF